MIKLDQEQKTEPRITLLELAKVFLRLGATAFGGPAAHIAMMRSEFVERRKWIEEDAFLDLIGACNLLPGPSSTEVGIFIGLRVAGWRGLVVAGVCFILPAMLIVSALAWCYVRFGQLPETAGLLYGIKPVIIAVIAQAVYNLARTALKSAAPVVVMLAALLFSFVGLPPLALLFVSGAALCARQILSKNRLKPNLSDRRVLTSILLIFAVPFLLSQFGHFAPRSLRISSLFFVFLKMGTTVFGSGYVLLAFLKTELVSHLHWITNAKLLDAVAVGQFTPGPVFTTATFIGYLLKGPVGAVVATSGIFLPAFLFVAAAGNLVRQIRSSEMAGAFLDGVNAAAIALMTFAGYQLAVSALVDLYTVLIMLASAAVLLKYRINSSWLVLAGGAAGLFHRH